ncbi:MAG: Homoserine dehydrogenase [Chloroflexi bacterium]|nr:Homoserine dehydrogenase [Chloroflexota bacterium]
MQYNMAFIGFGNVGKALARLLVDRSSALKDDFGIDWRITGVASRRIGWLANPAGFDVEGLLEQGPSAAASDSVSDVRSWMAAAQADVLFEMSSLDTVAGQPAISYVEAALIHGAHAVTANKGTIVYGYRHLRDLAVSRGKGFRFESTVMDGAPIFSVFRECLPLARVSGFQGILNSTTNFILGEIEQGSSLEAAIRRAQELGLAETDPAADVDGFDAAVKIAAIVSVIMDYPIRLHDIAREGIRGLDDAAVRAARQVGTPYKLVCRAERQGSTVVASVRPEIVASDSPLGQVSGTSSIVHFDTDMLPGITITEHTPTPVTTAYGMLADFIGLAREDQRKRE